MLMPQHELRTCVCVGPFVDDFGHAAFFDKSKKYVQKQIVLDTKRDLLTSIAAVIRSIAIHKPDIVVGSGQGGAVAIALASPLLLEVCLAARNFKLPELREIAPAWSKVKQIVAIQPRLARKDPIGPMFKLIAPELFDQELQNSSPSPEGRWGHASVLGVIPRNYRDTSAEDLFRELNIPVGTSMGAISWNGVMDRRPRLMWEHEGQCQCGRKTYLAGQCRKCALEDAEERHIHRERQAAQEAEIRVGDYELVVPAPGSQPVAHTDSGDDCVAAWLDTSARVLMLRFDREHQDIDQEVYRTYGPGLCKGPTQQASKIFLLSHSWLVSAFKSMPVEPTSPSTSFRLAAGLDGPVLSLIFVNRWAAGQQLVLPRPSRDDTRWVRPPHSTLPISDDWEKYTLEDWEDYRFRISFFSEDKGATWRVLQHCVEIGHEISGVVDAAFRASLKTNVVDTCVICTTNWSYFDVIIVSVVHPAFC
jgi:hypothetical protein